MDILNTLLAGMNSLEVKALQLYNHVAPSAVSQECNPSHIKELGNYILNPNSIGCNNSNEVIINMIRTNMSDIIFYGAVVVAVATMTIGLSMYSAVQRDINIVLANRKSREITYERKGRSH